MTVQILPHVRCVPGRRTRGENLQAIGCFPQPWFTFRKQLQKLEDMFAHFFFFFFLLELLISKSVKFLGKQSLVSILEIPRPHLILLGGKITKRNLVYCVSSALLHFVFHTKKKGNLRVCKSVSLQQPERAEKRGKSGNEVLTNLVP